MPETHSRMVEQGLRGAEESKNGENVENGENGENGWQANRRRWLPRVYRWASGRARMPGK